MTEEINKENEEEIKETENDTEAEVDTIVIEEDEAKGKETEAFGGKGRDARKGKGAPRRGGDRKRGAKGDNEYDQKIIDIARVTRVMAGGKRMRFRACVALGNKKGKIGMGIAKGADVTIAVNKAVNKAKKNMIDLPIINDSVPFEIFHKFGSAKILFKPAGKGKGVISGGVARVILELGGIKNIITKSLGTSNKINCAYCTFEALGKMKEIFNSRKDK